jgi:hypothetical protein
MGHDMQLTPRPWRGDQNWDDMRGSSGSRNKIAVSWGYIRDINITMVYCKYSAYIYILPSVYLT